MSNKNVVTAVVADYLDLGEGWEVRDVLGDGNCYCIVDKDLNGRYYYLDREELMLQGEKVGTKPSTGAEFRTLRGMVKQKYKDGINRDFVNSIKQDIVKQKKKSRTTELQNGWKLIERVSKKTGEKCIAIVNENGNGKAFYENGEEADIKVNKIGERRETDTLISGYDHIADLLAEKNIKAIMDEVAPRKKKKRKKKKFFGNLFSKKPLRNINNNKDVSMGTHSAKNRSNSLDSM